MQHVIELAVA